MAALKFAAPTVAALTLGAVAAFNMPAHADPPVNGAPATVYRTVVETRTVNRRLEHRGIWWWRDRAIANRKEANAKAVSIAGLARKLRVRWAPTVDYAYRLASAVYGVSYWNLRSVGGCESTHDPFATNGRYRGVMQEGPMFESSPFGRAGFSVFDPIANVLTAARVMAAEGYGQWECKP